MKRLEFETKDKNGNKILCEVIATYHDDEINKDFIIYTDKTFINNKLKVYYSLYEKVGNNIKLIDIQTNKEKKIGLELIKSILQDLK